MRKMMRKIALIALALMLCTNAFAMLSLDKGSGSVMITLSTPSGVVVPNAVLDLHYVGEPVIRNNNLVFEPVGEFAEAGISLENLSQPGFADELVRLAGEPLATQVTDENGRVRFVGLNPGLFLVKQSGYTEEMYFTRIMPFLIAAPSTNAEGDGWDYAVEANPKVAELPRPSATPEPSPTPDPESTPVPTAKPTATPKPSDNLPQTGMLRWPIPVMGVGGLLLFTLGWVLCFMKKSNKKDA